MKTKVSDKLSSIFIKLTDHQILKWIHGITLIFWEACFLKYNPIPARDVRCSWEKCPLNPPWWCRKETSGFHMWHVQSLLIPHFKTFNSQRHHLFCNYYIGPINQDQKFFSSAGIWWLSKRNTLFTTYKHLKINALPQHKNSKDFSICMFVYIYLLKNYAIWASPATNTYNIKFTNQ